MEKIINRDIYLSRLIDKKENGLIKVITGIRRCGKSYLLFYLFRERKNRLFPLHLMMIFVNSIVIRMNYQNTFVQKL